MGYDFEIKYKTGKENSAVDALSRQMQCAILTTVHCSSREGLEEAVQADPKLKGIIQDLLSGDDSHPGYELKKGRLFCQGRIVAPKDSPRITLILREFHDSATGAFGFSQN